MAGVLHLITFKNLSFDVRAFWRMKGPTGPFYIYTNWKSILLIRRYRQCVCHR